MYTRMCMCVCVPCSLLERLQFLQTLDNSSKRTDSRAQEGTLIFKNYDTEGGARSAKQAREGLWGFLGSSCWGRGLHTVEGFGLKVEWLHSFRAVLNPTWTQITYLLKAPYYKSIKR